MVLMCPLLLSFLCWCWRCWRVLGAYDGGAGPNAKVHATRQQVQSSSSNKDISREEKCRPPTPNPGHRFVLGLALSADCIFLPYIITLMMCAINFF